jgi:hypothetical protein
LFQAVYGKRRFYLRCFPKPASRVNALSEPRGLDLDLSHLEKIV